MTQVPTPSGWYPDPAGSGQQRWWDGAQWAATVATPPKARKPRRLGILAAWLVILVVVGGAVALVAHNISGGGNQTSNGTTTAPTSVVEDQNLVPAQHQQCADLGQLVNHYLATGDTNGNPQLDQDYATERAAILGQPSASRAALARADADNVIQECDKTLSDQEAAAQAQAQAKAQAEAQAQARAQADAAANAAYRSTCAQHGGAITTTEPSNSGYGGTSADPAGEYCMVTYHGTTWQVPITAAGAYDLGNVSDNKGDCDGDAKEARTSAQEGFPWSQLPVWHADTGLCERGSP